jgi:hypothetical protein
MYELRTITNEIPETGHHLGNSVKLIRLDAGIYFFALGEAT